MLICYYLPNKNKIRYEKNKNAMEKILLSTLCGFQTAI